MLTAPVHPGLQRALLREQFQGAPAEAALLAAAGWLLASYEPALCQPALQLLERVGAARAPALLAALAGISSAPCRLGLLLWTLLRERAVSAPELLSSRGASDMLAAALRELAVAARDDEAPGASDAAERGFAGLLKAAVTCNEPAEAQRAGQRALAELRTAWLGGGDGGSGGRGRGNDEQGAWLLAEVVRVVSDEVFPRGLARR
jgi:hypothetical protein